jgi:phosphoribosylglycinamide formyltransferase 1
VTFPIAVLVSGTGTNLQAILDTVHGTDGIEVVGVASNNPNARALQRAADAGVETGVFAAGQYGSREERDAALGDWLEARGVELIVLAGFMELLSPAFIRRFGGRIVNVHPSLLPAFPGLRAIEQALEYGVRVMGVTVHFVDEGVDSGPVILQKSFELPLSYSLDIEEIENRVHAIEHELLPQAIRLIARGSVRQDPDNPRRTIVEEQVDVGH